MDERRQATQSSLSSENALASGEKLAELHASFNDTNMMCVAIGTYLTNEVHQKWTGEGGVGLYQTICMYAVLIEQIARACYRTGVSAPGVFLYEVSSEFGQFLQDEICSSRYQEEQCKKKIGEILFEYFSQYPENASLVQPIINRFINT